MKGCSGEGDCHCDEVLLAPLASTDTQGQYYHLVFDKDSGLFDADESAYKEHSLILPSS